jgi:hypothetical protein
MRSSTASFQVLVYMLFKLRSKSSNSPKMDRKKRRKVRSQSRKRLWLKMESISTMKPME